MITITEAIRIIKHKASPLLIETIKPVIESEGYELFRDIYSPINMPPFRQSAMDGYALNLHESLNYNLIGEVKAGDRQQFILEPGETVRIFTGAPVPDNANAIVMQEKVITNGKEIKIEHSPQKNQNIRPLGEQVKKGEIALKKGTELRPAAIGYLTSLGITKVPVYNKPRIALVTTGNELVKAGKLLSHGKIFESNSVMLQSALRSLKFNDISLHNVDDQHEKIRDKLESVMSTNDLVIITGGISVGDYDFVRKALKELKIEEHFYKVKQKPGKPLLFGQKENTLLFALPGNPAAALTCFYIYVYTVLQKMMNKPSLDLMRINAQSNSIFIKKGDRPQFLKAIYNENKVEILEGQSSAMLQTFALSNALVFLPEEISKVNINDWVETILLPV